MCPEKSIYPLQYLFANKVLPFPDSRFLFEGHLTVGQEPPPPAWLVAQNLAREFSIVEEPSGDQDGNNTRTELGAGEMPPALVNFLNTISGTGDMDFEAALEASLQVGISAS
jgi:E3 ubiquitin-protein ligase AIP2